jgi:hypothetical protein
MVRSNLIVCLVHYSFRSCFIVTHRIPTIFTRTRRLFDGYDPRIASGKIE